MRSTLKRIQLVVPALGWRGLVRRLSYVSMLNIGVLRRRLRIQENFDDFDATHWHFCFDLDAIRDAYGRLPEVESLRQQVGSDAGRVLAGEMQFYGWTWKSVGWPPRWHHNSFTASGYPLAHWTEISDNDPTQGDVKDVWELSRLPFTFLFARAHVLTGDDRYVEAWWEAVEDWAKHNPPNAGVNWRCGQETSLRAIAWAFGLSVFRQHPASTAQRVELLERLLAASVERVRPTIAYALSQRNNHAISELVFLLSVLGPKRQLCRQLLEVLDDQFYSDGSYSQQSFTYQRLAAETLQWLLVCRHDLPPGLRTRVIKVLATTRDFLERCSDPVSGWLPNYGPNDGAQLFHLSSADYRDFRPFLHALGCASDDGRHAEPSIWVRCREVVDTPTAGSDEPTTYVTLRGPNSLLLTRLGSGRHRPGHADQQAVDLWIDGRNVVIDPGTYRYTAPSPWGNALTGIDVHATSRTPGESVSAIGRFLAEGMPSSQLVHWSNTDEHETLVARRAVAGGFLWRAIVRHDDAFAIVDFADGVPMEVRWNFGDLQGIDVGFEPLDALDRLGSMSEDPASGWASNYYAELHPVDAGIVSVPAAGISFVSIQRRGASHLSRDDVTKPLSDYLPLTAMHALSGLVASNRLA